jgi:hypothetical protein
MSTPVVLDFYTRSVVPWFDEKKYIAEPTVFMSMFGHPENGSVTTFSPDQNAFDGEITRGNLRTATLVPRGTNARPLGSPGATQPHSDLSQAIASYFSRKYPLVEEYASVTADQTLNRVPGESPFEGRQRVDRYKTLMGRGYEEGVRRIIRLDEYLASQSILTGKQPVVNLQNTTDVYDWRRNSGNNVTVGTLWSGAGTPLTDIDNLCEAILQNGKVRVDTALMGGKALGALLGNSQLTTVYANKLFYDLTYFGPNFQPDPKYAKLIAGGAIPYAKLRTPRGYDITIFTYPHFYQNAAGAYTKYLTDNSCVLYSTQARADRFFGPPEAFSPTVADIQYFMERLGFNPNTPYLPQGVLAGDGVVIPETIYAQLLRDPSGKVETLRLQHAPIFQPTQTDGFGVLQTLA